MGRDIKVFGHRGYRARYPENTLLAFRKAFEAGADGVECDVQKSRDGRFVVIHDDTIAAATGKDGRVAELTLTALKRYDAGSGERFPELGELLDSVPREKQINIELKRETVFPDDCAALHDLIVSRIDAGRCLISSFNHELLPWFRDRGFRTGLLIGEEHESMGLFGLAALVREYRPAYLNLPVQAYQKFYPFLLNLLLRILKISGLALAFWTVNTEAEFAFAAPVADIIITDDVEKIITLTQK